MQRTRGRACSACRLSMSVRAHGKGALCCSVRSVRHAWQMRVSSRCQGASEAAERIEQDLQQVQWRQPVDCQGSLLFPKQVGTLP